MSRMAALESMMGSLGASSAQGALGSSALATGASTSTASTAAASTSAAGSAASSAAFAQALAAAGATPGATPGATSRSAGTAATGDARVESARQYLGVPYVWGGESASGMDCSGLVQRALADLGVEVPRTARQQMGEGTPVASLDDAVAGDLLVFKGGKHIGIYVGDGRMIHAPVPGKVVSEVDVYETPTAIRRVLPAAGAAGASDPARATTVAAALSSTGAGTPPADALSGVLATADVQRLALQMMTGSAA